MIKRKTFDVTHTGKGGPVRIPLERYTETHGNSVHCIVREAAEKVARRMYGKNGTCMTCHLNSHSEDGTFATYQCFVCRPDGYGGYAGKDVWVYWSQP